MKHGYICECTMIGCKARIYLTLTQYRALSRRGRVVTIDCAKREEKEILRALNDARVVSTIRGV